MKRILALALLVCFALAPAWAQQEASPDAPATKEDVEKLFTTMRIREQMRKTMELAAKQSTQMGRDALKKKIPDIGQADLDQYDSTVQHILKDFDFDGLLNDIVPIYQRHWTKTDVAVMSAFYDSPTGQKMLREQPEMTAEAMKAMQPRMEKMMNRILDESEKMGNQGAASKN